MDRKKYDKVNILPMYRLNKFCGSMDLEPKYKNIDEFFTVTLKIGEEFKAEGSIFGYICKSKL